ncbi:MAG: DUF2238 domain-containing protein [Planctomycetota bacterium]
MSAVTPANRRLFRALLVLFGAEFALLGISPLDRPTWLLENALVAALIALLLLTRRRLPLSRLSYAAIFGFLALHEVGSHYTYSEVPYDAWLEALCGITTRDLFGWERNHFDRAMHFLYGLLLVYPMRELFLRWTGVRGFWGYFLPLDLTLSTSVVYELLEWAAAATFGEGTGTAYLGTQGDAWDAQKDVALAGLGALMATVGWALFHWRRQRDFAAEWAASLRVKSAEPLDADAAAPTG